MSKKDFTDLDIAKRMTRTAKSAQDRNKEYALSFKKMKELLSTEKCYITGVDLQSEDDRADNFLTLERIDNSKGYTDDNVVACSSYINKKKGDLTVEEVEQIYLAMVKKGLIKENK